MRLVVALFVSLAACGGTSTGRDGASGGSATGGATMTGGTGGPGGGEGGEACLVREDTAPNPDDICAGLDYLTVTDWGITEEDGDGRITIGETFVATFELRDDSGFGFDYYPGLIYEVEPTGITLSPMSDFAAYALHPCGSMKSGTRLVLGSSIGPGTMIEVTARAGALNQDCPNAPSSTIRIAVVE